MPSTNLFWSIIFTKLVIASVSFTVAPMPEKSNKLHSTYYLNTLYNKIMKKGSNVKNL